MAKLDLLSSVLESVFFKSATKKAGKIAGSSFLILRLVQKVVEKASSLGGSKAMLNDILDKITTLGKLIKCYVSGEYREVSSKTLLKILAAFIYFLSPFDFIPDVLPVLGLTDDLALLTWVIAAINDDLEKFSNWELKNI